MTVYIPYAGKMGFFCFLIFLLLLDNLDTEPNHFQTTMKIKYTILLFLLPLLATAQLIPVRPSSNQVEYQKMEMVGFLHFGVNTFTDREWGLGDESEKIFNPSRLDAEQWVRIAKKGGIKELILTTKHHDGFCLWPSKFTEHSVKNSPWKNGKGDVVGEFVAACRKYGIKVGFYLSPWDRNHKDYGKPEYITHYRKQVRELLTQYGEINEFWLDGANGGTGYYGGANEKRVIDYKTYYQWPETIKLIKTLQPNIKIFSDAGPDMRWVGNEKGIAGPTSWSVIDSSQLVIGKSDTKYLNMGDPKGNKWLIPQADVSIRPGWFYHATEDTAVRSPENLTDLYYKSVGRNAVLLLNIPPDRRGLIADPDSANLLKFREIINTNFVVNLAKKATFGTAGQGHPKSATLLKAALTDTLIRTAWNSNRLDSVAEIELSFAQPTSINCLVLAENVLNGQNVSAFQVTAQVNGKWENVFTGTTIGQKRIICFGKVNTTSIKLKLTEYLRPPSISQIGVYEVAVPEK